MRWTAGSGPVLALVLLAGCSGAGEVSDGAAPTGVAAAPTGVATATAAAGGTATAGTPGPARTVGPAGGQDFPDVVDVDVDPDRAGTYDVSVTLSSPYDSPQRYADAFRVVTLDGEVLGVRELTHDHADEQPFTRTLTGLVVPDGVDAVRVEGRDQANGWGGQALEVAVP